MADMTVEELKRRMDAGEKIFVLDVREPHEYQIANIGGHLIPLNDLPKRVGELDASREIVVHCKMGGRSAKAVDFLRQSGFATCITWQAASMHGPSASIRRYRSTKEPPEFFMEQRTVCFFLVIYWTEKSSSPLVKRTAALPGSEHKAVNTWKVTGKAE